MPHSERRKRLEFMRQSDCIAQELPLFANYSANTLSRGCYRRAVLELAVDASLKYSTTRLLVISTLCQMGRQREGLPPMLETTCQAVCWQIEQTFLVDGDYSAEKTNLEVFTRSLEPKVCAQERFSKTSPRQINYFSFRRVGLLTLQTPVSTRQTFPKSFQSFSVSFFNFKSETAPFQRVISENYTPSRSHPYKAGSSTPTSNFG